MRDKISYLKFKTQQQYKKPKNYKIIKQTIANNTYRSVNNEFPRLFRLLLEDLSKIEGYSDVVIGFGSGVSLDIIRKILLGNTKLVTKKVFHDILALYTRVFCDMSHHIEVEAIE